MRSGYLLPAALRINTCQPYPQSPTGAALHMIRHFTTLSLLALVVSCTTRSEPPTKPAFDSSRNPDWLAPDLYPNGSVPEKEPVVRYGRYTLVSTLPTSGQRDLMAQIIDISIPANMSPNVRDAMQYVMNRSGYSLCAPSTGHINILYTRPLPAAQYKLGPMTLRNTLQVLAGPAWQVKVDEVNRQVCYALRTGYQLPDIPKPVTHAVVQQDPSRPTVANLPAPASAVVKSSTAALPTSNPATPVNPGSSTSPPVPIPATLAKDGPSPEQKPAVARPAPASPPRAPAPAPRPASWTAPVGSTLHQTIADWCKQAGWQLIWQTQDLDYPIEAPLNFNGTFQEAIAQIFPLYDNAPRRFTVDGNAVQRMVYVSERKP